MISPYSNDFSYTAINIQFINKKPLKLTSIFISGFAFKQSVSNCNLVFQIQVSNSNFHYHFNTVQNNFFVIFSDLKYWGHAQNPKTVPPPPKNVHSPISLVFHPSSKNVTRPCRQRQKQIRMCPRTFRQIRSQQVGLVRLGQKQEKHQNISKIATKMSLELVGRAKNSTENALGHLGRGEKAPNDPSSILVQAIAAGQVGQVRLETRKTSKYHKNSFEKVSRTYRQRRKQLQKYP